MTPLNKFTTSFGAVCTTDVQMTWTLQCASESKIRQVDGKPCFFRLRSTTVTC